MVGLQWVKVWPPLMAFCEAGQLELLAVLAPVVVAMATEKVLPVSHAEWVVMWLLEYL